jgi:PDZ domain-containing secreted protein
VQAYYNLGRVYHEAAFRARRHSEREQAARDAGVYTVQAHAVQFTKLKHAAQFTKLEQAARDAGVYTVQAHAVQFTKLKHAAQFTKLNGDAFSSMRTPTTARTYADVC